MFNLPHIQFDAKSAFLILIFAAVFTLGQAVWGLLRVGQTKRAVNRRLKVVETGVSLGDLVIELRKQRGLDENGERKLRLAWLADLIVRSGVVYAPRKWAVMVAGLGLGLFLVLFLLTRNPLLAVGVGVGGALFIPVTLLKMKAGKRAKLIGIQLPDALEVIVRSLEAGHPVPTAIALVGKEMKDPIGTEFGMAADEIAFGATLQSAVGHMSDRCRHPDVDLFAATIRLQERSGGNLTGLLKMNAKTVRDRHKMRMKIQAASSEGRASAMILSSAPFVVMGILMIINPHFYGDVINERPIQIGLGCLGVWMTLGNLVMRKMIDMRI